MDPSQQQQAANQIAAMGSGLLAFAAFFSFAITAFFIWMFWRIFTRAGMSGALSLLNLVPFIGPIIVICILAFGKWNVAPVPPGYEGAQPPFPPTGYAPQSFSPTDPVNRL